MPTDDSSISFAAKLKEHRRQISAKIRSQLSREQLVLFDGEAVASDEVDERYRAMKRQQMVRIFEVALVLAGMAGAAFALWRFLIGLAG